MESNSEPCIDLSSIIAMEKLQASFGALPENLTTGHRVKKGVIRKIIRNQKTFLELFNKYQCEVRNLQVTIENKFKKVNVLEARLLDLARMMHSNTSTYLVKKQRNQQLMTLSKFSSALNLNPYYQGSSPEQFEEMNARANEYNNQYSPLIEPIIDIHVSDEEESAEGNEAKQVDLNLSEPVTIHSETSDTLSCPDQEESSKGSGKGARKVTIPVSSKTQFMQLVDKYKQSNNLAREKVAENVMALRARESDIVLGYQCSVDGCTYMHFLRAQVNRHFKNYHSKTCNHCNQRFKRPLDLLIHLNENKLSRADLLQLQSLHEQ